MAKSLIELFDVVLEAQQRFHANEHHRPFVCVTWAQSLDGMIAAAPGVRTPISCAESMEMTHGLRALHDAILVGVGTVLTDDPRLSCRIAAATRTALEESLTKYPNRQVKKVSEVDLSPRAVVLDAHTRTPVSARILHQPHCARIDRRPVIFGVERASDSRPRNETSLIEYSELRYVRPQRRLSPEEQALHLHCHLSPVLEELRKMNISSVMVEGGASVISSFLEAGICDLIVVTVSPMLFGKGLHIFNSSGKKTLPLTHISKPRWLLFGDDMVLTGALT